MSSAEPLADGDGPLLKRADENGDAVSCPYEPPVEDSYCVYTGLSKRANDAKEISLPWSKNLKFSNYPQCPSTGTKGITNVPKVSPKKRLSSASRHHIMLTDH